MKSVHRPLRFALLFLLIVPSSMGLVEEVAKNAVDTVVTLVTNVYNIITGGALFIKEDLYLTSEKELDDTTPSIGEEYDFVIIGAGTAGSVMANRLSEIPNVTVLLVEAGPKENLIEDIPLLAPFLQFSDSINYKYLTEPSDDYCRGMTNNQCSWPRGKVMGGSSVINLMVATRGNHEDYDNWAVMGNVGWSFNDLLKYFKKLENFNCTPLDKAYHGFDGPMHIENVPYRTKISEAYLEAAEEMGFPTIDYDGQEQIGFAYTHATVNNGERWSINRGYLYPIHGRPNLFLTRNTRADKVLIDPNTKKAYGVFLNKDGTTTEVRAKKEVIICTGTVDTPKLLMLSGIGPADQLRELGINVLQDSKGVGENLIDHLSYWNLMFTVNDSVTIVTTDLLSPTNPAAGDYLKKRRGPFTISGGGEIIGFINVDDLEARKGSPNVEYFQVTPTVGSDYFFHDILNIDDDHYKTTYGSLLNKQSFMIIVILLSPKSRGKITLKSKDPGAKPQIYPNYLSDADDVRVMTKGIRYAIELSKAEALQKYNSTLVENRILGCEKLEMYSDEYWDCALRTFGTTTYHPVGTSKMGPVDDPMAVVDPRLKVYGIDNLRVVDASIIPTIISGHLNVPVMAIAEKAADMVKEDWGYATD
ncbi:hypothetical protein TSAR_005288 [Trichomalopsis sarcophagae]|uniref:Glucose-methanol-choline oxidoreductase N-terminal domain-containing protein n=1 Tax=Trichomalopsis sarcophagae TaxID=543379 RepID=A0A232F3C0_9HYME|nr:hypothetical protein TSAR_005288 [Trichomalopsis sarcophagae]